MTTRKGGRRIVGAMTHKVASTTEREKEGGAFAYLGFTRASNTTNEVCRRKDAKKREGD